MTISVDPQSATDPPRLAILCDYVEEGWPSMDLVADELYDAIRAESPPRLSVDKIRPRMRRRFGRLAGGRAARTTLNLDRLASRFVDYPVFLRRMAARYDMFHIADHSYAHLAHGLPADRTGVYCHDLDAFRCLIDPRRDPRPAWFRKLAMRILDGLKRASVVFYSTNTVRDEILAYALLPADRLVHAPYGVAAEYTPSPGGYDAESPYVLHIGTCIPRKRIDVLLDVVAGLRREIPRLRLVHAGGPFSPEHDRKIDELGLRDGTESRSNLTRSEMADLYRRAAVVLLPSEAEGFGLPVIEALACGSRVVASDIPVLREVGGDAVTYCAVGEVRAWTRTVRTLIDSPAAGPSAEIRAAQAARFTWREHARIIVDAYASEVRSTPRPSA